MTIFQIAFALFFTIWAKHMLLTSNKFSTIIIGTIFILIAAALYTAAISSLISERILFFFKTLPCG